MQTYDDSLCGLDVPVRPFKLRRIFGANEMQEIFLDDHLALQEDDTIDDVIGKVASFYKLNVLGFCIFSLKEQLIYRINNMDFDVNPFVVTSEYTGAGLQLPDDYEILHTKCLIDFEIPNNELYVVYIDDLMQYTKLFEPIFNDLPRYINNVLAYYFKRDFIESNLTKTNTYVTYEEKAKVRYNFRKTTLNNELNFKKCVLLEAQVLVNENETTPFIDLQKIFNIITLDSALPFVYQRGNNPNEVRLKVLNGITHVIEDVTILTGWLNSVKNDMESKSNKALLLKVKNYNDNYTNVTIYRNGKIEIRCQWPEEKAADTKDLMLQVERVSNIIQHINKHKYNLPKLPDALSGRKIVLPDVATMMQSFETGVVIGNTRVSLCNISNSFTSNIIDFELLNDHIAKNFYPVANVVYKNTKHVFDPNGNPTTYYAKPSSIYLRYKQYSGYGDPKNAMTFIYNVTANTIGLKRDVSSREKLANIVSKKFTIPLDESQVLVNNIVENFAYSFEPNSTLEYAVNKVVKNPGIEVRISKSQATGMGQYKYMFIGNISLFYASKITEFVKSMLSSYFSGYDIVDVDNDAEVAEQEKELEIDDMLDDIELDDYLDDYNEDDYLVENVFDDSEYDNSTVPSEAIPNDPNASSVLPKVKPSSVMKGKSKMSMLDRLRDVNDDLYGDLAKYGSKCQKPFQPAVMSIDEINTVRSNVSKELSSVIAALNDNPGDSILEVKKKHLEYNKKAFESGVTFMNMYYACPSVWCPTCNNFIPFYDISDSSTCPVCKQNIHYRKDYNSQSGNSSKTYYPVFRTNNLGKMVPCCGVRRYHGWDKVEEGLIKKEEYNVKDGIVETSEQDENYILRKNRLFLAEGRIGHLPDTIAMLFEGRNKNCLNEQNEVISFLNDENINCYLRMGVRAGRQSFLNAIVLATPYKSVSEMLTVLFDKLTVDLFITLKNGSLRYMFRNKEDDTPENALENFKNYIEDKNNVVDERLMWEVVSSAGIIMAPANIIIISMIVDDKKLSNPSWLCPLGYDSSKLFSLDRKSMVLIKYDNTYEMLIKSSYENGRRIKNLFFKENDSLARYFVNVLDKNCTMEYHKEELMESVSPMTAQEIVAEINKLQANKNGYVLDRQILDGYNRIEYLVTRNNLKIPVNLYSGPLLGVPVVDYNSVALLDYNTTLRLVNELASITNIPIAAKSVVIDNDGSVMGIIVASSNFIETLPYTGKVELKNVDYKKSMDADAALRKDNTIMDKRISYIEQKEFGDESYERLRYELSKYLASNDELKDMFSEILASGNLNSIHGVVVNIFDDEDLVAVMETIDLSGYKVPPVRKVCFSATEKIQDDIHCYYENGRNKVVVFGANNYAKMMIRLANELHSNVIKRDEILEDNVSDVASGIMGTKRENERVYENLVPSKIQKIIKELYLTDDPMENALEGLYDVKNPEVSSKYIRKPFVYNFEKAFKLRVPIVKKVEEDRPLEDVENVELENVESEDEAEAVEMPSSSSQKITFKTKQDIPAVAKKKILFKPKTLPPPTVEEAPEPVPVPVPVVPEVEEAPEPVPVPVPAVPEVEEAPEPVPAAPVVPEVEEAPEPVPDVPVVPEVQEVPEPVPATVPAAPSAPVPSATTKKKISFKSRKDIMPSPFGTDQKITFKPVIAPTAPTAPAAPTVPVAPTAPAVPTVPAVPTAPAAAAAPSVAVPSKKKISFKTKSDVEKDSVVPDVPSAPSAPSASSGTKKINFKIKSTAKMPSPF